MLKNKKGFTLIELLIVVVIIGILAAIAIPKFGNVKEKANIAAIKSDLKALATAQEVYFAENATYTSLATLGTAFKASAGDVVTVTASDATTFTSKGVMAGKTCTYDHATGLTTC